MAARTAWSVRFYIVIWLAAAGRCSVAGAATPDGQAPCEPACENGGLCLDAQPADELDPGQPATWSPAEVGLRPRCFCPAPWGGSGCNQLRGDAPNAPPLEATASSRLLARQARLRQRLRTVQLSLRRYQTQENTGASDRADSSGPTVPSDPPEDAQAAQREVYAALCASGLCDPSGGGSSGGLELSAVRSISASSFTAHLAISPPESTGVSLEEVQRALEEHLERTASTAQGVHRVQLGLSPGAVEVWLGLKHSPQRAFRHQAAETTSQLWPQAQAQAQPLPQQPALLPLMQTPQPPPLPPLPPSPQQLQAHQVYRHHILEAQTHVVPPHQTQLRAGTSQGSERRGGDWSWAAPWSLAWIARVRHSRAAAAPAVPGGVDVDLSKTQGISENSAGDLKALRSNVLLQLLIVMSCFVFFTVLRKSTPLVYQGEQYGESATLKDWTLALPDSSWGWLWPTSRLTVVDVVKEAGIDRGMYIRFLDFAIQVMWTIGAPLCVVLSPLHYYYGGMAAGQDKLSQIDMANVSHGSWLCWVHAAAVWFVVITVQRIIYNQKPFFEKQLGRWKKKMPAPRCNTVLVQNINGDMNTAEGLTDFFEKILGPGVVACAFVVKDTTDLQKAKQRLDNTEALLAAARGPDLRRDAMFAVIGGNQAELAAKKMDEEQEFEELRNMIDDSDEFNLRTAFVTFFRRRDAGIVLRLFGNQTADEEIQVMLPPDPQDIIWKEHIILDPEVVRVRETMGYGLGIGLFVLFVPIALFISAIARWESLHATFGDLGFGFDPFRYAQEQYPEQVALWNGLVGTLVLTLLMGFVPAMMMSIYSLFFVLKAKTAQQLKLQEWYFYFLVVFVLLVTAIGSSDFGLLQVVTFLVRNPLEIFPRLAEKMPSSTHFYLEYLVVQCSVQALNITRYWVLINFQFYKQFNSPEQARRLSEPEDQNFYGIGSLSARSTLNLTIALVFCTLTPIICLVAAISFSIAKLVHSYLAVYAEIRKPDIGGEFFYRQLVHTQQGLFLYVVLMTGVLTNLADSFWPGTISAAAFLYMIQSYNRFKRDFKFREMGLHELEVEEDDMMKRYNSGDGAYSPVASMGSMNGPMHTGDLNQLPRQQIYKQPELPAPKPVQQQQQQPGSQWSWLADAFSTGRFGDVLSSAPARVVSDQRARSGDQQEAIFAPTFSPPMLRGNSTTRQQQQQGNLCGKGPPLCC